MGSLPKKRREKNYYTNVTLHGMEGVSMRATKREALCLKNAEVEAEGGDEKIAQDWADYAWSNKMQAQMAEKLHEHLLERQRKMMKTV